MTKKIVILLLFLLNMTMTSSVFSESTENNDLAFIKKTFVDTVSLEKITVVDSILGEKGINNIIYKLSDKTKKTIGYARRIITNTGCGGHCAPLIFTLFYDEKLNYFGFSNQEALTKKYHTPFTESDYQTLKTFLKSNTKKIEEIPSPWDVIDAITMATKRENSFGVVKEAALTTYRMLHYKLETKRLLKEKVK